MSSEPANSGQAMIYLCSCINLLLSAGIKWRTVQSEPPDWLETGRRLSTINRDTVIKQCVLMQKGPSLLSVNSPLCLTSVSK